MASPNAGGARARGHVFAPAQPYQAALNLPQGLVLRPEGGFVRLARRFVDQLTTGRAMPSDSK